MILFISDRLEKTNFIKEIFGKNKENLHCMSDETSSVDMLTVNPPDIIIIDTLSKTLNIKSLIKKIKQTLENPVILLITDQKAEKELIKHTTAFITDDMSKELVEVTINVNLRLKNSLEQLSSSNKDLADSHYMLNTLYSTSSQFAGTLDKNELINYMIEGMDKSLSF